MGFLFVNRVTLRLIILARILEKHINKNTTVYACIQEYVKACASCPIIIKRGDTVIENKTLMTLLQTPNMGQTWDDFLEQAIIYYLCGGEANL